MKFSKKLVICLFSLPIFSLSIFFNAHALGTFDSITHINSQTGTKYDTRGFDIFGYDKDGYTRQGFDHHKIHKITKTHFSDRGYDIDGYSKIGAYSSEFAFFVTDEGFADSTKGYNSKGFNFFRKHRLTNTEYDPDGYNAEGFDRNGIHRETHTKWSPGGFNVHGKDKSGIFVSQYHKMHSR